MQKASSPYSNTDSAHKPWHETMKTRSTSCASKHNYATNYSENRPVEPTGSKKSVELYNRAPHVVYSSDKNTKLEFARKAMGLNGEVIDF